MKKIIAVNLVVVVFLVAIIFFVPNVYANTIEEPMSVSSYDSLFQESNQLENQANSEIVDIKSKAENELEEYEELYGSKTYGYTAYVLNKLRIFSIPLCFLGIAIGSIYQYVLGIRKMDVRDKGFGLIIGFVTVLVICQILPLVFAIVVQGWRG